jgi:hypothetical protein
MYTVVYDKSITKGNDEAKRFTVDVFGVAFAFKTANGKLVIRSSVNMGMSFTFQLYNDKWILRTNYKNWNCAKYRNIHWNLRDFLHKGPVGSYVSTQDKLEAAMMFLSADMQTEIRYDNENVDSVSLVSNRQRKSAAELEEIVKLRIGTKAIRTISLRGVRVTMEPDDPISIKYLVLHGLSLPLFCTAPPTPKDVVQFGHYAPEHLKRYSALEFIEAKSIMQLHEDKEGKHNFTYIILINFVIVLFFFFVT